MLVHAIVHLEGKLKLRQLKGGWAAPIWSLTTEDSPQSGEEIPVNPPFSRSVQQGGKRSEQISTLMRRTAPRRYIF